MLHFPIGIVKNLFGRIIEVLNPEQIIPTLILASMFLKGLTLQGKINVLILFLSRKFVYQGEYL